MYYDTTVYHGHLITPTLFTAKFDHTILSQRQFLRATFDHTEILSQRQIFTPQIKGMLNVLKQAFLR
jgi:hypothetical protein